MAEELPFNDAKKKGVREDHWSVAEVQNLLEVLNILAPNQFQVPKWKFWDSAAELHSQSFGLSKSRNWKAIEGQFKAKFDPESGFGNGPFRLRRSADTSTMAPQLQPQSTPAADAADQSNSMAQASAPPPVAAPAPAPAIASLPTSNPTPRQNRWSEAEVAKLVELLNARRKFENDNRLAPMTQADIFAHAAAQLSAIYPATPRTGPACFAHWVRYGNKLTNHYTFLLKDEAPKVTRASKRKVIDDDEDEEDDDETFTPVVVKAPKNKSGAKPKSRAAKPTSMAEDNEEVEAPASGKRAIQRFTIPELEELKKAYRNNKTPNMAQKKEIARELNIDVQRVTRFYGNASVGNYSFARENKKSKVLVEVDSDDEESQPLGGTSSRQTATSFEIGPSGSKHRAGLTAKPSELAGGKKLTSYQLYAADTSGIGKGESMWSANGGESSKKQSRSIAFPDNMDIDTPSPASTERFALPSTQISPGVAMKKTAPEPASTERFALPPRHVPVGTATNSTGSRPSQVPPSDFVPQSQSYKFFRPTPAYRQPPPKYPSGVQPDEMDVDSEEPKSVRYMMKKFPGGGNIADSKQGTNLNGGFKTANNGPSNIKNVSAAVPPPAVPAYDHEQMKKKGEMESRKVRAEMSPEQLHRANNPPSGPYDMTPTPLPANILKAKELILELEHSSDDFEAQKDKVQLEVLEMVTRCTKIRYVNQALLQSCKIFSDKQKALSAEYKDKNTSNERKVVLEAEFEEAKEGMTIDRDLHDKYKAEFLELQEQIVEKQTKMLKFDYWVFRNNLRVIDAKREFQLETLHEEIKDQKSFDEWHAAKQAKDAKAHKKVISFAQFREIVEARDKAANDARARELAEQWAKEAAGRPKSTGSQPGPSH